MLITYPHMGYMSCILSVFFSELGIRHVAPPENDMKTMQKGSEISPEEMCMPFKLMAGNLRQAYEEGADTAVMAATCGPCRLGEYGQLLMEVMEGAGCHYDWILLDSPADIGVREFLHRCRRLTEGYDISGRAIMTAVLKGLSLTFKLDRLVEAAEERAGYLEKPYEAVELLHYMESRLKGSQSFSEGSAVIKEAGKRLSCLKRKEKAEPVNIMVTGEIYTSIENAANNRLTESLMMLGCSVKRHLSLSWWIKHTIADIIVPDVGFGRAKAGKGIPCNIGGYARQTVAGILKSTSFDGVIKLMPAGCMPEIVAKAFCQQPGMDDYRILHLVYDGLSGDAGYRTRLEAFVDMLERRKNVLAGNRYRLNKH